MTFILNQNGTCAIPLGQVKRLYIEHGENWYKIMALVHPCDNDKRKINLGIFKRLETAKEVLMQLIRNLDRGWSWRVADDEVENKCSVKIEHSMPVINKITLSPEESK